MDAERKVVGSVVSVLMHVSEHQNDQPLLYPDLIFEDSAMQLIAQN